MSGSLPPLIRHSDTLNHCSARSSPQNVDIPTAQTQKTQYSHSSHNMDYIYDNTQNTNTGDKIINDRT